jgi:hypothetical protein
MSTTNKQINLKVLDLSAPIPPHQRACLIDTWLEPSSDTWLAIGGSDLLLDFTTHPSARSLVLKGSKARTVKGLVSQFATAIGYAVNLPICGNMYVNSYALESILEMGGLSFRSCLSEAKPVSVYIFESAEKLAIDNPGKELQTILQTFDDVFRNPNTQKFRVVMLGDIDCIRRRIASVSTFVQPDEPVANLQRRRKTTRGRR